ncbi:MAG: hypothetical protein JWN04_4382 [Myxococcaceae bacterium]|nr:hypothetical protein [Myxococcaceae bacterium]
MIAASVLDSYIQALTLSSPRIIDHKTDSPGAERVTNEELTIDSSRV